MEKKWSQESLVAFEEFVMTFARINRQARKARYQNAQLEPESDSDAEFDPIAFEAERERVFRVANANLGEALKARGKP